MKRKIFTSIFFVIYIFMISFFIYKCLENGTKSTESSNKVVDIVVDITENITNKPVVVDDNFKTMIRKLIGHFGYFLVLGTVSIIFYLLLEIKKYPWIKIVLHYSIGILLAFISEFVLEANTSGRGASIQDVGIDIGGFVLLSTIILLIYLLIKYKKNKVKENKIENN